jgi:hypothetical protein
MNIPTKKNVLPDSSPENPPQMIEVPTTTPPTEVETPSVKEVPVTKVAETPKSAEEKLVPLSALEQERAWRKEWEQKYKEEAERHTASPSYSVSFDDDLTPIPEIKEITQKLQKLERNAALAELEVEFPVLKDKKSELEAFLEDEDMKKLPLEKAVKFFVLEKNLPTQPTQRKGLEPARGGGHTPPANHLTAEEIKLIREREPRKYIRMLTDGSFNPDTIK